MATNVTPDQIAQRAERLLADRVDTVRRLAEAQAVAQQARHDEQAALVAAERAGWTTTGLGKLGFDVTAAKATWRRRQTAVATDPAPDSKSSTGGTPV